MKIPTEAFILRSWNRNALRWNELIDKKKLESRTLVTDNAIIEVLLSLKAQRILDVGCGEGWLTRRMTHEGLYCQGIDGSTALIKLAQGKGFGTYACLTYGDIISGCQIAGSPFDCIVFNFALFDQQDSVKVLKSLTPHLVSRGKIVIQSLHPDAMLEKRESRWIPDIWQGLPGDFTNAYAFYLRSMNDWKKLFKDCCLQLERYEETVHPYTQRALSVIFVLSQFMSCSVLPEHDHV